jgi:hypothetical protein
MKISDVNVAKAVIAHEAVDCFLAKEESASKQPTNLVSCTGGVLPGDHDDGQTDASVREQRLNSEAVDEAVHARGVQVQDEAVRPVDSQALEQLDAT